MEKKADNDHFLCPGGLSGGRTTQPGWSRRSPLEAYVFKNWVSEIATSLSWKLAKVSRRENKGGVPRPLPFFSSSNLWTLFGGPGLEGILAHFAALDL